MIYNEDFLFLHYPKTAGKSLTRFFIEAWKRPIEGLISRGQFSDLKDLDLTDVDLQAGRGHENFVQSSEILREKGKDIEKLRAIFVCIRNPYDLMVSNYFFMRQTYKNNRQKRNFELAATVPFEQYCVRCTMASPERWMTYRGKIFQTLRIVRFEQLTDDLRQYSTEFGFSMAYVPHLNATNHKHYLSYITPAAEEAIYKHFRFMFDNGYYQRHSFDSRQQSSVSY